VKKVTYFDVEYANNENKSICQMGIMCENYEDREPVFPELDIYINPNDGFDTFCTQIHGICADTVKDAPSFPEIWTKIEKYFTNSIIIGHNVAGADLDALVKALRRYNIDIPEMYYVDTLEIAREHIPSCYVKNYGMSALCAYFDICIDNEHNAFDDACANADLLRALSANFQIILDDYVQRYIPHETNDFIHFVSNPTIRKSISELYGIITGIVIDEKVRPKEYEYIVNWKKVNQKFDCNKEIHTIINVINNVGADGIVTIDEMDLIKSTIKQYLDNIEYSQITLATQVLAGILKGITCDNEITYAECKNLREWLYEHNYLRGHFPFDKIMKTIDSVLADNIITKDEADSMFLQINELLDPVETLKGRINDVKDNIVCLSGVFSYGQKSAVKKYIVERGGIVEDTVKKPTNFLIIGSLECDAYSNGKYGTKVKKAIEYNQKGCSITIIKESDFFKTIK
jgi:DNA polymerase III epsilon subunit-like protein